MVERQRKRLDGLERILAQALGASLEQRASAASLGARLVRRIDVGRQIQMLINDLEPVAHLLRTLALLALRRTSGRRALGLAQIASAPRKSTSAWLAHQLKL